MAAARPSWRGRAGRWPWAHARGTAPRSHAAGAWSKSTTTALQRRHRRRWPSIRWRGRSRSGLPTPSRLLPLGTTSAVTTPSITDT
eukprot:4427176-Pyramimonas_sp.AAC.1